MAYPTLSIKNFGPIKTADIELNKLNIIGGINGSGKSSSSKLLYCLLIANSKEGNYLANNSIYKRLKSLIRDIKIDSNLELSENLYSSDYTSILNKNIKSLKMIIDKMENKNDYLDKLKEIEDVVENNKNKNHKYFDLTNTILESEFEIQDLEYGQDSNVKFYMTNDCNFTFELIENNDKIGFTMSEGNLDCLNVKNIIYLDSPSIFDGELKNKPHHFRYLSKLLNLSKAEDDVYDKEFNKKQDDFFEKIQDIIGGYIYYNEKTKEFLFKKAGKEYSMKTTASGVKQMGIIQFLLKNRVLDKNTFLIIDEPETNLHPEWQVKFAQIIVLLLYFTKKFAQIN